MTHIWPIRSALSRRTLLRGAGAAVALPWLDAMLPAGRSPLPQPRRAVFVFAPNGIKMDEWTPAEEGALPEAGASPILAPLAPFHGTLRVLSGLDLHGARSQGDGPGDHARAAAAYLTCAHPVKKGKVRAGVSVDQRLAASIGGETRFRSLELGLERGAVAGVCDSGYSCAYSNHVAWRTPTTPLAKQANPRAVFERLFGEQAAQGAAAAARLRTRRSVLDAVLSDAKALGGDLGTSDRAKLDDYLTSVREVEQRLQAAEAELASGEVAQAVARPEGLDGFLDVERHATLMYELIALAFEADATRVVSLMLGNAGSGRSYPEIGVPEGHHELSHHRGNEQKHAKIGKINRFHVGVFAGFLAKLGREGEAGRSLLDDSAVLYGSGISDGNRHDHGNLPILLAGGASSLPVGRHDRFAKRTPLANLYVTLLRDFGVDAEAFADSTGALAIG